MLDITTSTQLTWIAKKFLMTKKQTLIGLLIGIASTCIAAPPVRELDQGIDCSSLQAPDSGLTGSEINQCVQRELELGEFELTKAYKYLLGQVDAGDSPKLVQAQRKWIDWRESEMVLCAALEGWKPSGSGYGAAIAGCKHGINLERTKVLRKHIRTLKPL